MGTITGKISLESLIITPEILNLIAEIDEFKGAWCHMEKLNPERLFALRRIASVESIGSSTRIEGAALTDMQVENLLRQIDTRSLTSRDEQEVVGYAFVCEKIFEHFLDMPLTENTIKHLHTWLLQFTDKDSHHRGEYKKKPIRIEAFNEEGRTPGILFETTSPFETPFYMHELLDWVKREFKTRSLHPLLVIAIFIVIFLAIHPFQDGNGRLSRLLTTWLMLKEGYDYAPYSSLESIIEQNKDAYYLALQKTQKSWQSGDVDWNPWLLFFLQCLQRQKRHLEVKLERERIVLPSHSPLNQEIINLVKAHGSLKISQLLTLTHANRNTIKKALAQLVKEKHLVKNGKGRATWYSRLT